MRKLTQYAQTTGVEEYGVVVWFGKCTDIASLVLLFGFTTPAYILNEGRKERTKEKEKGRKKGLSS